MEQATTTLCVFEPKWKGGGHHPSWFKELVAQWLSQGYRVIAFCPAPSEVLYDLNDRLTQSQLSRLLLHEVPDQSDLLGRWANSPLRMFRILWMAKEYNAILEKNTREILPKSVPIYFGLMDLFALKVRGLGRVATRCFSRPFIGLYFFPPTHERHFLAHLLIDELGFFRGRTCEAVLTLNEELTAELERHLEKPVWALPDFLAGDAAVSSKIQTDDNTVEQMKKAARGRRIVLLAGDISPRKGVSDFLDLAELCSSFPWYFVIAGHVHRDLFSREELQRLDAAASLDNVLIHPHRIESDEEFNSMVASSDVLYAAYPDFRHSSNQLIQSAAHQIPILVSEGHLMERRVRKFHLGAAFPYGETSAMVETLRSLMEADELWVSNFQIGCQRFCEAHSAEAFAKKLARICIEEIHCS